MIFGEIEIVQVRSFGISSAFPLLLFAKVPVVRNADFFSDFFLITSG